MINRVFKKSLTATFLVMVVVSQASAALPNRPQYDTYTTQERYVALSKYSDYHKDIKLNDELLNNNVSKTHSAISNVYDELDSIKYQLEPKLRDMINKTPLHYRWLRFNVNGPIKLKLSGTSNGTIKAEISGFDIYAKVKAEKSWYVNVYASISLSNGYASGEYDVSTGKIKNLNIRNNFRYDVDSTFNYILPFIDDIGDSFLKNAVEDALKDTLSNYSNNKVAFGLNDVLPPYKYVYDGVDYGWQLQQHLIGLIEGEFIEIDLYDRNMVPKDRPNSCREPGYVYWNEKIGEINLSDKAFIKIERKVSQKCNWTGFSGEIDY